MVIATWARFQRKPSGSPSWSINLSLPADRVNPGEEYPGDVFYRNTDRGLCLVAVAWSCVLGRPGSSGAGVAPAEMRYADR